MTASMPLGLGLAVTTATGVVGVAVGPVGGEALAAVQLETDRRHAEELVPRIQEVTADAGVALGELDTLVVDVGPGRFTGLRVGLTTVRSLAFALGIPVVGLTTLEILAAGYSEDNNNNDVGGEDSGRRPLAVTAVVDARRGEVFQQVVMVEPGPHPDVAPRGDPVLGRAENVVTGATAVVVGDGADQYCEVYRAHGRSVLPGRSPDAVVMLALAAYRPSRPGRQVEPVYLRHPDVNPNVKLRPRVAAR